MHRALNPAAIAIIVSQAGRSRILRAPRRAACSKAATPSLRE
jgi:hypothetical protein